MNSAKPSTATTMHIATIPTPRWRILANSLITVTSRGSPSGVVKLSTSEFLVDVGAVHLSGVEEGDALLDGGAQHGDHVVTGSGVRTIALRHPHAAHADGRYLKPLSERSAVHAYSTFCWVRHDVACPVITAELATPAAMP